MFTCLVPHCQHLKLHVVLHIAGLLPGEGGEYVPRANLSTIEVEALMREKVRSKYDSLKQVFLLFVGVRVPALTLFFGCVCACVGVVIWHFAL